MASVQSGQPESEWIEETFPAMSKDPTIPGERLGLTESSDRFEADRDRAVEQPQRAPMDKAAAECLPAAAAGRRFQRRRRSTAGSRRVLRLIE